MTTSLTGVAYAAQIDSAARRYHLDPRLLAAVAAQETGGPGSTSGRNIVGDGGHGHGLFQIDDRSHAFASSTAAMDPQANADYAASMLSQLLDRYGGNVREALSAYNSGDPHGRGTPTTWPDGRQLGYADSVMRHYDALSGGTSTSATNKESCLPMSSFLSHIARGVESGLCTLATTGSPALAAGAGVLGAVSDQGGTSAAAAFPAGLQPFEMPGMPLLPQMQAENPTERQNVNQLSAFADLISSSV